METIHRQNFVDSCVSSDGLKKDMVPRLRKGDRSAKSVYIVFECSAQLRKSAIETLKLYIDFVCCRVKEYIEPMRCYRCQRYGHLASRCKLKEVCSVCAEVEHNHNECKWQGQEQCTNCKRDNNEHYHRADFWDCPAYTKAYEMEITRSTLWYPPVTGERGTLVEQYVMAWVLRACNQAGHLLMYVSPARDAETYIDVTLATSKASWHVLNWEVVEESSSDHRLILY
ncbi:hypothetical protein PR048_006652 [Dryococelus australis]|uniref:CCHC-type domain-containing protein n=1 Tax=Dryococelus australis TaxID=614101 RepID=A0ABQ9IBJ6_9NEOP|nr:hypothetical protein PR048_006652 [Dryococelus australis]